MPKLSDEEIEINQGGDDLGPVWKRFGKLLARFYPLVVVYVIALAFGTLIWAQLQTPLYRATATILVDPTTVVNQAERQSLENLALQATLIESPAVLNGVIDRYNLSSIYPFNKSGNPMAMLQNQMNVRPFIKSKTIEVSFLFMNGEEAAKIANAIAETYVYSSEEKSQGTTQESVSSLQLNLSQETARLEEIKSKTAELRKQFPDMEDDTNINKQVDYFNSEMTKAGSALIELRTKLLEIDQYQKENGSIYNHPYILDDPMVGKDMERLRAAESTLAELKQQFRDLHPDVITAQARFDSLKKATLEDQDQVYQQLQIQLKTLESTRKRMKGQLEELKSQTQQSAPQKVKLKNLLDEQDAVEKTIKLIQDRLSVASVEGGLKRPGVEILSRAIPPQAAFWPNKSKMISSSFFFALATSLGLLFLFCYFDRSIRTYEDVELATGKLFLGDLTFCKVKKGELYPEFPSDKAFILFTHGLRLIATNIEFVLSDRHQKSVLFTSAVPGEGKSFVSFHIAQSMARQGKKVVLIDADFCQSTLKDQIPKTDCEFHLHEYLTGSAEIQDIVESTDNELIHFIRSGGKSQFSAPHALKSGRMKQLIDTLKQHYDYVLVDAPPVLPVNDAIAVSQHMDMRVVVIRWGHTHRDLVRKTVSKIAPGQLVLSGVVLNQVKESLDKGYHIYNPR